MSEPSADLSFDRATYATPQPSAAPCRGCKKPLTDEYWQWRNLTVCAPCRAGLEQMLKKTQSRSVFQSVLLKAGGTALACGVGYALFVEVTNIQIAFATIGIAIAVATVIRKATNGVSGRQYQLLAVVLTYVGASMGYAPGLLHAVDLTGAAPWVLVKAFGLMLALPVLTITDGPLGTLIVGFGLWSAWRRTVPTPIEVAGPFRVTPTRAVGA